MEYFTNYLVHFINNSCKKKTKGISKGILLFLRIFVLGLLGFVVIAN